MRNRTPNPAHAASPLPLLRPVLRLASRLLMGFACLLPAAAAAIAAQSTSQPPALQAPDHVLDHVIAVVNNQVILASDLDLEMRIFQMLPVGDKGSFTAASALDRLTTRALIEQQILQEDPHGLEVDPNEVIASLAELRQNLPACKRRDCVTPAGWTAYLATLGLTPDRVDEYWTHRMAVLRFIERRFRSGIRIAPEEIQKYYNETLAPQYPDPADAPPLEKVSARIQEVLLQQQVNTLLNEWLKSLQDQGQVEILDPVLAAAQDASSAGKGGVL
jgi:peptidyl-prolyl cis-trans isomerase SurA